MIKAVFFDLYGTLAGFSPSRYEIQSQACADFGIEMTPEGVLKGYALADAYMAEQNAVRPLQGLSAEERGRFFAEYERQVLQGAGVQVTAEEAGGYGIESGRSRTGWPASTTFSRPWTCSSPRP